MNSLTTSNYFLSIFSLNRYHMSQMMFYQRAIFRFFTHLSKPVRASQFKSNSIVEAWFLVIVLLFYCNFSFDFFSFFFLAPFFSIMIFSPAGGSQPLRLLFYHCFLACIEVQVSFFFFSLSILFNSFLFEVFIPSSLSVHTVTNPPS